MADKDLTLRINAEDNATEVLNKTRKGVDGIVKAGKILAASWAAKKVFEGTIGVAMDFEKQMKNVSTMMDLTTEAGKKTFDSVRSGLLDIAQNVPISIDSLSDSLYNMVSSGYQGKEALEMVNTAAKLATAGATDAGTAAYALTAFIKGYGDASVSAKEAADLLYNTNVYGITTFEELAVSISGAVPSANMLGVSQLELAATTATLVGKTGNAAEVSTQLMGAFNAMLKPNKALISLIQSLGYESAEAMIKANGLKGTLDLLKEGANKSNVELKDITSNVRAANGLIPLMTTLSGDLTNNLNNMGNASGIVDEAFKKQMEASSNLWDVTKNRLAVAGIELGTLVLPLLSMAIQALNFIIQNGIKMFSEFWDTTKKIGEWLLKSFLGIWETIKNAVSDAFTYIYNQIKDSPIVSFIQGIIEKVQGLLEKIGLAKKQSQELGEVGIGNYSSKQTSISMPKKRAIGGPVSSGSQYLVGERGPELFTPSTSGMITPNNQLGGGGVVINLNNPVVRDEGDIDAFTNKIIKALRGVNLNNKLSSF